MKQVQKTIGRWVQRLAGKSRIEAPTHASRQPIKLDEQALRQVSGGTDAATSLPVKGW